MARVPIDRLSPQHREAVARKLGKSKKPKREKPVAFGIAFDSKLELDFVVDVLEPRRVTGEFGQWQYHEIKFRIADNKWYTPDFTAPMPLGRVSWEFLVFEIKGSWKMKNARDSRTRLEVAAYRCPMFTFCAATRNDLGLWDIEEVSPHYGTQLCEWLE